METKEALEAISTGHAIWAVDYAEEVCKTFGVKSAREGGIVQVFESDRHPLGVTMYHGPEEGVWSLSLAQHVAECLGVEDKARGFFGRGSQAREFARVVQEALQSN